ncbi:MAG: class I SAM-dependent methyltransferase [Rhodospirillaceae bacterium]|nr:class I SAM-dependent methyltransferase [Rhodospirillaceae bacterium]
MAPGHDTGGGYVTSAPYVMRFHRALNPRRLGLAVLANGFAPLNCDAPYTYMELGFGQGVSLVMLAAANPHAQFYGVDLLPEHVEHARGLATAAGVTNLHLFQISFADLTAQDWPAFDLIAMHGVWTWVAANYRADILRLVDAKLKPGGLAYVSYNTLPGWAAMEPVRELLKAEYDRANGTLPERVKTALMNVRAVEKAQPIYFRANPTVSMRLEHMEKENPAYLAHEYLNAAWAPFYFEDVSREFESIGLPYVASGNLQDNVGDIAVKPEAKALYAEMTTTLQRETLKDVLNNKQFRRDVYMRGPRTLSDAALTEAMACTRFAALMKPSDLAAAKLTTEGATLTLNAPVHRAFLKALEAGPRTVAELCATPALSSLNVNAAFGTLFLLAAMSAVEAAASDGVATAAQVFAERLNTEIDTRKGEGAIPARVSAAIGAGVEA